MPDPKSIVRFVLSPLRGPATWACQRGLLPSQINRILPWRWALKPFSIYGKGWKCRWFPTDFDAIGQRVFWSGLRDWGKETTPVILDQIRKARCFLDIGANCGIYTVLGAIVNPNVRIFSLEPVPRIFAALKNNVTGNNLNEQVTALNVAVGESNGTVPFHQAEDATQGSLAVGGYRGLPGSLIQVECRTLDSIVEEFNLKPDFIKIDVEGFEGAVLAGATRVLSTLRPRIVLEANPGDSFERINEILKRYAYIPSILTDRGPEPRTQIIPDEAYRNWLCLPAPL